MSHDFRINHVSTLRTMQGWPERRQPRNMSAQSISPLTLPVVTIQHTFPEVIQEVLDGIIPSDKFWVSCYKTSETSVHAKVLVELDEIDRDLVNLSPVEGNVEVLKTSNGVSLSDLYFELAFIQYCL